ncbi:MAG: TonB-dependent receptor plug domain-containing protein [Hyphomonadaceae bacterium JAD_PAG50586_4]|nr:MAG: TonB-dependent receptor plug domain-containing protein [Hyphomonadaceae bacterium JAD_PAG50586_4]
MSKSKKSFFKNSVALAMLAGVMTTGQAFAQNQTSEEEAEEEEAIVVTGSRIRSEFNSASPIQVITTDAASLAGVTDTGDMVQSSSLAAGSPQIDATISSAFVTDGGPGAQTISLRGLGANRTLVLLNGRRAGPAGTRGAVSAFDLNVLPLSMIDRVEILKDGASSIYGSDAVAGVVNIITRDDLDGGAATLRYSLPEEDGGSEIAGDITWGTTFDRGYFNVSVDYYLQEETLAGQRDYTNCAVDRTWDVATGLRNDVIDLRTGERACRGNVRTGLVWLYDLSGSGNLQRGAAANFIQPDPSGQIGVLNPGSIFPAPAGFPEPGAPANWFQVDYGGAARGLSNSNSPFEQNSSIIPEIERATFFSNAGFDITPRIEAYAEVLMNRRETAVNGFRQVWTYLYSYDLGDSLNPGWTGATILSPTPTTDHADASQRVDYMRAVAGVRGDFDGWLSNVNWDVFVQHSLSDAEYTNDRILADAVYSADGRSDFGTTGLFNANSIPRPTASCVGYNTPVSNRPCVDVDWVSANLMLGAALLRKRKHSFTTSKPARPSTRRPMLKLRSVPISSRSQLAMSPVCSAP